MPSGWSGLLVFLLLVAPGAAYVVTVERLRPNPARSAFHETLTALAAAWFAWLVAMATFAMCRVAAPSRTPDIGDLVTDPAQWFEDQYQSAFAWGAILVAGATAVAIATAYLLPVATRLVRPGAGSGYNALPIWSQVFNEHQGLGGAECYYDVQIRLDDGSSYSGPCSYFSPSYDETLDRDLALTGLIRYRPLGAADTITLDGAVVVSAHRITAFHVSIVRGTPPTLGSDQLDAETSPGPGPIHGGGGRPVG